MWTLGITHFQRKQKEIPITLGKQSMAEFSKNYLARVCSSHIRNLSVNKLTSSKTELVRKNICFIKKIYIYDKEE